MNVFTAFPDFNFPRFIFNSVLVTTAAVLLCLFFSATAGYGFAKFRFRGNNLLFTIVLATIMITFEAIVVPLYILVRQLGISNTYWGLIIPESLTAFGVFMMRQFFYSLPDDFLESARIDGANEYVIFARIGIPMAKTALLALVIFHAQWVWNLLLWPMILISNPSHAGAAAGHRPVQGRLQHSLPGAAGRERDRLPAAGAPVHLPVQVLRAGHHHDGAQGLSRRGAGRGAACAAGPAARRAWPARPARPFP